MSIGFPRTLSMESCELQHFVSSTRVPRRVAKMRLVVSRCSTGTRRWIHPARTRQGLDDALTRYGSFAVKGAEGFNILPFKLPCHGHHIGRSAQPSLVGGLQPLQSQVVSPIMALSADSHGGNIFIERVRVIQGCCSQTIQFVR